MDKEKDLHRRYTGYIDFSSVISSDDAGEIVGCADGVLGDRYPEEPDGGSYFHNLRLLSEELGGADAPPPGIRRYVVHIDIFRSDRTPDFIDRIVEEANDALDNWYAQIAPSRPPPQPRLLLKNHDSFLVHDPTCFYCGEREDAEGQPS